MPVEQSHWLSADWATAIATAVGAIGAIVAAIVAMYAALDARRSAAAQRRDAEIQRNETKRQAEIQRNETKRQGAIALEAMLFDYHKAILSWSDESIDWMSQARTLTYYEPEKMSEGAFFNRRADCLCKISALIDRGRLFFPNEAPDAKGQDKPRAFRGFRPVVLSQLKNLYDYVGELHSIGPNARSANVLRESITECKREFVSEIQSVVNPQARQGRLEAILSAPSASAAVEIAAQS